MENFHPVISVFGSAAPKPATPAYESARRVGRLLAETGFTVQTGGYSGVMAAASQGASEVGGHVIGITCAQIEQFRPMGANQWVAQEIKKQTLRERLLYLVDHCAGAIVMPGGVGTLSELSLIWSFVQVGEIAPVPIIAVGELWQRTLAAFIDDAYVPEKYRALVASVGTEEKPSNCSPPK
jgi:uncharacterized protein (TIGR00730 family)